MTKNKLVYGWAYTHKGALSESSHSKRNGASTNRNMILQDPSDCSKKKCFVRQQQNGCTVLLPRWWDGNYVYVPCVQVTFCITSGRASSTRWLYIHLPLLSCTCEHLTLTGPVLISKTIWKHPMAAGEEIWHYDADCMVTCYKEECFTVSTFVFMLIRLSAYSSSPSAY